MKHSDYYAQMIIGGGGINESGGGGTPGQAATIHVGSTTTGEPGTDAQVTNVGTENAAIFDFVIPRGADGADGKDGAPGADGQDGQDGAPGADGKGLIWSTAKPGGASEPYSISTSQLVENTHAKVGDVLRYTEEPTVEYTVSSVSDIEVFVVDKRDISGQDGADGAAATIQVGQVTTGEPGTDASVTNVGTENAAIFDFVIPRGADGADGEDGAPGADGQDGQPGADGKGILWVSAEPQQSNPEVDVWTVATTCLVSGLNQTAQAGDIVVYTDDPATGYYVYDFDSEYIYMNKKFTLGGSGGGGTAGSGFETIEINGGVLQQAFKLYSVYQGFNFTESVASGTGFGSTYGPYVGNKMKCVVPERSSVAASDIPNKFPIALDFYTEVSAFDYERVDFKVDALACWSESETGHTLTVEMPRVVFGTSAWGGMSQDDYHTVVAYCKSFTVDFPAA